MSEQRLYEIIAKVVKESVSGVDELFWDSEGFLRVIENLITNAELFAETRDDGVDYEELTRLLNSCADVLRGRGQVELVAASYKEDIMDELEQIISKVVKEVLAAKCADCGAPLQKTKMYGGVYEYWCPVCGEMKAGVGFGLEGKMASDRAELKEEILHITEEIGDAMIGIRDYVNARMEMSGEPMLMMKAVRRIPHDAQELAEKLTEYWEEHI